MKRRPDLDALAERIAANATWGDIALPSNEVALVRRIADRVGRPSPTHRTCRPICARGFGVLFVGNDTAEKLRAAAAVANASRRALYRVDISARTPPELVGAAQIATHKPLLNLTTLLNQT
jgi:hypothetical protein